ncbi:hypothetical protein ACFQJC_13065 [Haloferax namakaokahaiae]|uniref:Uncharacterized protein n=1 Tax=Haloferax namakaokahaiae TaxID=1748331 RepID=A0ABD5ZGT6_9EURY
MERFHVYHSCLILVGVVFASMALTTLASEAVSVPAVVQAVCGLVLVGASGYELNQRSPSEFDVGPVGFWAVVAGTVGLLALVVI